MMISLFRKVFSRKNSSLGNVQSVPNVKQGENSVVEAKIEFRHPSGSIVIGANCTIKGYYYLNTKQSRIDIGDNVSIGGGTILESAVQITIYNDVLISYQCILHDSNNHSVRLSERINDNINWNRYRKHDWNIPVSSPIVIGRGCWIGARSIILKGVQLGEGCIVGAGSVVTMPFPEWSIIAGNPARLIRKLTDNER